MTDRLREAAEVLLVCVDYMLKHGEWYFAQERADELRAALAEKPVLLTEEQVNDLWREEYRENAGDWLASGSYTVFTAGFRAAESAHGIRGGDEESPQI